MYRQYPPTNRSINKADRDRAYQNHMNALRKIKHSSIDTSEPSKPGRLNFNPKRQEINKQRDLENQLNDERLNQQISSMQKEKHFPTFSTKLQNYPGDYTKKERMRQITKENQRLLNDFENVNPSLNRNEWYLHKIQHEYQVSKNSTLSPTLPMAKVIKMDLEGTGPFSARPQYNIHEPNSHKKRYNRNKKISTKLDDTTKLDEKNDNHENKDKDIQDQNQNDSTLDLKNESVLVTNVINSAGSILIS